MTNNNVELNKQNKSNILGGLSVIISIILAAFIINYLTDLIPLDRLEGIPALMPIPFAPIGAAIGFAGYRISKTKLSLWGAILNIVVFTFPIVYYGTATIIEAYLSIR